MHLGPIVIHTGGTQSDGVTPCVTRNTSVFPGFGMWKIPLSYSLLSTDSPTNNMAAFPDGASDSTAGEC